MDDTDPGSLPSFWTFRRVLLLAGGCLLTLLVGAVSRFTAVTLAEDGPVVYVAGFDGAYHRITAGGWVRQNERSRRPQGHRPR